MSDTPETLISRGYQARKDRHTEEARRFFSEAVQLCNAENNAVLASAMTGLGQIERDLKNTRIALDYYVRAASIYRSASDPLRVAHTIRHIGDILREDDRPEDAKPCYEEALAIYRQDPASSTLDIANALRGFALLNENLGEPKGAHALWQEARHLYESLHVQAGVDESDEHLRMLLNSYLCKPAGQ